MDEKNLQQRLIDMIMSMPEREPPHDLTPAILQSLAPKRASLFRRLCLRLRSPRLIAITPLKFGYAAALCIFIWVGALNLPIGDIQKVDLKDDPELVSVNFTLSQVDAQSVCLIGSFNGWRSGPIPMRFDTINKIWVTRIDIPAGSYEYAFLIDNEYVISDPKADFSEADGFGTRNSIILAKPDDENFL